MTIGKRLMAARESKGYDRQQVADMLGVNKSTITRYELDMRQPDFEMLVKLADVYGVTTDYLINGDLPSAVLEVASPVTIEEELSAWKSSYEEAVRKFNECANHLSASDFYYLEKAGIEEYRLLVKLLADVQMLNFVTDLVQGKPTDTTELVELWKRHFN